MTVDEAVKRVFLVRHGRAQSKEEDPERPLTTEGRAAAERMAQWAAQAGFGVAEIRHSGKRRAEETAALFAEHLQPAGGMTATSGLAPTDDVLPVAGLLEQEDGPVMLVGHLPFLGHLAGQLVTGNADRTVVHFGPAALAILSHEGGGWVARGLVQPEMLA